jgi:hypothetical protein
LSYSLAFFAPNGAIFYPNILANKMKCRIFAPVYKNGMKKAVSILLLVVLLVAGAHPVVSMHFCGGELYDLGITGNVEKSCCSSVNDTHPAANGFSQSRNSCCDIQKINIATDDFQTGTQLSHTNRLASPFSYCAEVVSAVRWLPANCSFVTAAYPPGGLAILHTDILACICTFRI